MYKSIGSGTQMSLLVWMMTAMFLTWIVWLKATLTQPWSQQVGDHRNTLVNLLASPHSLETWVFSFYKRPPELEPHQKKCFLQASLVRKGLCPQRTWLWSRACREWVFQTQFSSSQSLGCRPPLSESPEEPSWMLCSTSWRNCLSLSFLLQWLDQIGQHRTGCCMVSPQRNLWLSSIVPKSTHPFENCLP